MPSQRVLFTSDLHARRESFTELVRWVERVRPHAVILGGDLFAGDPKTQIACARGYCYDTLARCREAGAVHVALLPGNDDWQAAYDALRDRAPSGFLHWLADAPLELRDGINVVGYPFVPLSPFPLKDHEKLDRYQPDKQEVLDGVATGIGTCGAGVGVVTKPIDGSESIETDLAALAPQVRRGRTIFVAHCPPRGTRLDLVFGRHAGSQAVREFLERAHPAVSLHGDMAAIDQRAGVFAQRLGRVLAVSAGQGQALHAVHFDAACPAETLEHTVLGPWREARARRPARMLASVSPAPLDTAVAAAAADGGVAGDARRARTGRSGGAARGRARDRA